jgi:hypothetical protein
MSSKTVPNGGKTMTKEEAIRRLKRIADNEAYADKFQDACRLAVAALEKQTPKKPTFEGDGYDDNGNIIYDTWICPCCEDRYEVDYERHNHCPTCGQTIDWSDTLCTIK